MAKTYDLTLTGDVELSKMLQRKSTFDGGRFVKNQTTLLYNEAKRNTPVAPNTKYHRGGMLRRSLKPGAGFVGYTEEYAPHVELGHRTKNGGYVQGQRFLQRSLDRRKDAFGQALKQEVAKK